ncbi:LuxR C-terminal-related transcriptional regulator [Zavarzinia sp. CC-PAN008]|uniref:LuxR C-terminal-related transcriptional regulator n=1 Tax=Zavarzinia sp. CC-PAN008 TaxID=3243332 RepID=UPI003F745F5D
MDTPKKRLDQFLTRLERMEDIESLDLIGLADRTRELLSDLGQHDFSVFSLRQHDDPRPGLFLGTMTENWSAHYINEGYHQFDPVMTAVSTADEPYTWDEIPRRNLVPRARQLFVDVGSIGYVNGIVVPMLIRGVGPVAFTTFARQPEVTPAIKVLVEALARKVARRVARLQHQQIDELPPLTPREAEILRWVALGLSAAQVGLVTGISARTVEYHLSNVQKKLNSNNQTNSVVIALAAGMLTF